MIEEQVKAANTPEEMRAELFRLRYSNQMLHNVMTNQIIHNVMTTADHHGLSGEDRYTMVAYHALKELQHLKQFILDDANVRMAPSVILCEDSSTELLESLEVMTEKYVSLVDSVQFGTWDGGTEAEVIAARKAIADAKKRQLKTEPVDDSGLVCQNCFKGEATMQAADGEYLCSSCWQKKQDD